MEFECVEINKDLRISLKRIKFVQIVEQIKHFNGKKVDYKFLFKASIKTQD